MIEKNLAYAAALFKADFIEDIEFKINAFQKIVEAFDQGEDTLDKFDIISIVEDYAGFRSDEEIWSIVQSLNMLKTVNDGFQLRKFIPVNDLVKCLPENKADISIQFIEGLKNKTGSQKPSGYFAIRSTIAAGRQSMLSMTWEIIKRKLPASTTFWVDNDNSFEPFGYVPSSFATLDSFLSIIEPMIMHTGLWGSEKELEHAETLLQKCVNNVLPESDKHAGALCLLPEDDDYPGGNCPAVHSNAVFVYALIKDAELRDALKKKPLIDLKNTISPVIDFLLKMQLPSGGWGVYRYEDHKINVNPTHCSTLLTVRALTGALPILDPNHQSKIKNALKKCGHFIINSFLNEHSAGSFEEFNSNHDIVDTAQSLITLLRIGSCVDKIKSDCETMVFNKLKTFGTNWNLSDTSEGMIYNESLRAPTDKGPSVIKVNWEQPGHAKVVTCLLDCVLEFNVVLDEKVLFKIEDAINMMVSDCKKGYWIDFKLEGKMFPSNTHFYLEALSKYMAVIKQI